MINRILSEGIFPGSELLENELQGIVIGNRIPQDFFETKGIGESDLSIQSGSYRLALQTAKISTFNIMAYTSILPGIARKVEQPKHIEHGSVLESVLSICSANKGERATAGIVYGWLYDKRTKDRFGGLLCEQTGDYSIPEIQDILRNNLEELYLNGYSEDFTLNDIAYLTESIITKKKFGTALAGLCFTSYYYPVIQVK